jgi:hypothetical protein
MSYPPQPNRVFLEDEAFGFEAVRNVFAVF